ncbi:MAG: excisionase family DNA-binding protein [Dermatophilaceae bacterium]
MRYVVEVDLDRHPSTGRDDEITAELGDLSPSVAAGPGSRVSVTIAVDADTLRAAIMLALAVMQPHGTPVGVTAKLERLHHVESRWQHVPELMSVTEAGQRLGVSRQRVLQMIAEGKLPRIRVGNQLVLPAGTVRQRPGGRR